MVTVPVLGAPKVFQFEGTNVAAGDRAKWVLSGSVRSDRACGQGVNFAQGGVGEFFVDGGLQVKLNFLEESPEDEPFSLCYKHATEPYKLYKAVTMTTKTVANVSHTRAIMGTPTPLGKVMR